MGLGLIGKKLGMTQIFDNEGNPLPITVVEAGPCAVVQIKTAEKDSYRAVQLGFETVKEKSKNRPELGHFKKGAVGPKRVLREFRAEKGEIEGLKVGDEVNVSIFKSGDFVDVTGLTKGRGFAGVIKRHGFSGFPGSHGTHEYFRHAGSVGSRFPQHTLKGLKMAGRYGNERVTIQNLKVVEVRPDKNLLLIKGALPGATRGYLLINKAKKKAAKSAS